MSKPSSTQILVAAFGKDRPGIVEDISRWLFERGGNIVDSRMALLGGEFAVLILAKGGPELLGRIEENRSAFEATTGLSVLVRQSPGDAAPPAAADASPVIRYALDTTCLDTPGVVFRVSRLLNEAGVNIVRADTHTTPAPFTGTPIFHLDMVIDVPTRIPIARLREQLRALGESENIDWNLQPASE